MISSDVALIFNSTVADYKAQPNELLSNKCNNSKGLLDYPTSYAETLTLGHVASMALLKQYT